MPIVLPDSATFDEDFASALYIRPRITPLPNERACGHASPVSVHSDDSQVTVTPRNWRAPHHPAPHELSAALQPPSRLLCRRDRHKMPSALVNLWRMGKADPLKEAATQAIKNALQADWPSIDMSRGDARTFCAQFCDFDRDVRKQKISSSTWKRALQMRQQMRAWADDARVAAYQQNGPQVAETLQQSLQAFLPESSAKVLAQRVVAGVEERIDKERRTGWANAAYKNDICAETDEALARYINSNPTRHKNFSAASIDVSVLLDRLHALGDHAATCSHTENLFFSYQGLLDHEQYTKLRQHFFDER